MRTLVALIAIALGSARGGEVDGLVLPAKDITIGSPVQEIIEEIAVEEGDTVTAGQTLARLMDREERLEVQRYEKVLEKARFDAKAAQTLYSEKMGAKEAAVEKKAELERLQIEQELAQSRLDRKTITSPIAGVVVKKYKEAGESVERVENLFDVVNIDRVYLQFYLDGKSINEIAVGQKIAVEFPTLREGKETKAEVSFVDPRIDAASGLFRVKLVLENPGHRIKAGMRVVGEFAFESE